MKTSYQKTNTKNNIKTALVALLITPILFSASIAFASPITEKNIEILINNERELRNIDPLKVNEKLDQAADNKSKDMINRDYFEHYAYGMSPWDFLTNASYDYVFAGENLAMDFQTAEGTVKAWMNSPAHRENILNPEFKDMGIGVVKGEFTEKGQSRETIVVTNMFGTEKPIILKIFDNLKKIFIRNIF